MTKIYIDNSKNLIVDDGNIKNIFKSTDPIFPEINGDIFSLRHVGTDFKFVHLGYSDIENENSIAYTNIQDLIDDIQPFFTSSDFTTLIQAVQNSGGTQLKAFTNKIVRPANTTIYTAGDVVGSTLIIADVAKSIGTGVRIHRIRIQTNDTGVAGKKFNVHVYNDLQSNVPADNAAFAIDWANAQKRIGAIPVVMGVGNLGTVGMNDYNELTLNPIGRDVYVVLESVDGFTPSAASTEFQITIDTELSNN